MASTESAVAFQFDDLEQQQQSAELGMWVFLATEVLFFGGLFLVYAIYHFMYPDTFHEASKHTNVVLGTVNTVVLMTSGLLMALAVHAAHDGKRNQLIWMLIGTTVLGLVFLGIKGIEYYDKYHHHLLPLFGWPFEWEGHSPGAATIFFSLYVVMTGLHAIHMIIGIGILLVLLVGAYRGGLLRERSTPVHIFGLYWHFVDIVWVFLFPLLYLIG